MKQELQAQVHPKTNEKNIIQGDCYRISVLTERLLRLEYSPEGIFEDRATQAVWNRNFPEASFTLIENANGLEVLTSKVRLIYDQKEFTPHGLSIQAIGDYSAYHSIWHYGEPFESLGGTARTLDEADGAIPLEPGVISKNGFSVLDDSNSLVLLEDGWITPRQGQCTDIYFWAYGHSYLQALKDFYHLCGKQPMVPRYALGNWWSRYYKYSESSYKKLMERFSQEKLPFSVAVIDMDWHLVDVDPKYGSGWTGYTWNRQLFPDPEGFLKWLHQRNLRVTLNIHPAEGIQAHEDVYPKMAKVMGVDTALEQPVAFDAADPAFLEACFAHIFHPMEDQGVDFWWLDWQSGGVSKVKGLDPLWVLNHYHFLDNGRDGRRPMTFSRYAGPGSHRYPVGFSGDTIITWDSLNFQPYFTSVASNIGYGMWSHDIGGHMKGERNDEMAGRWLQFGVFSPVLRLHSSNSAFSGKEPWNYRTEIREMMGSFLRLRHQLLPYLYTMNHRAYQEDIPLVLPMYYHYPEEEAAYAVPNQYEFGSQLLAAPITTPDISNLNVAKTTVWLPQGMYFDFFSGWRYQGGRTIAMYRGIESIPVLAKAGAIVPMTDEIEDAGCNPGSLCIHVFAGASGAFTLYEDDNVSTGYQKGVCITTAMRFTWGQEAEFIIEEAKGDYALIPELRDYTVQFHGIQPANVQVLVDGAAISIQQDYDANAHVMTCRIPQVPVSCGLCIRILSAALEKNNIPEACYKFLHQAEISFCLKDALYNLIQKNEDKLVLLSGLQAMNLDSELMGALMELITA